MSDTISVPADVDAALAQEVMGEIDAEFAELEAEIQRIAELPTTAAPEKVALLAALREKWRARLKERAEEAEKDDKRPPWRKRIDKVLEGAIEEILEDQEVDLDGNLAFKLESATVQKHAPAVMQALASGLGEALTSSVSLGDKGKPETGAQQLMRQLLAGFGTAFGQAMGPMAANALKVTMPKPGAEPAAEAAEPADAEAEVEAEPAADVEAEGEAPESSEVAPEGDEEPLAERMLDRLFLDPVDDDRFRGYAPNDGRPRIFGGLVAGQAMLAAAKTIDDEERQAHSLHAYFLQQGDPAAPIDYVVTRVRDGGSFSTRHVEAVQGDTTIFTTSVSFHRPEPGMAHQSPMPAAPPPDEVPTREDLFAGYVERAPHNLVFKMLAREEQALDRRSVDPTDMISPQPRAGLKRVWFKTHGRLPDHPALHRAALTYASDYGLLPACVEVHGVTWMDPRIILTSLDHAVWFHRPFRADDWLLYVMESPSADAGRGFNMGRIYSRDGMLVASVAQEGLMRIKLRKKPRS